MVLGLVVSSVRTRRLYDIEENLDKKLVKNLANNLVKHLVKHLAKNRSTVVSSPKNLCCQMYFSCGTSNRQSCRPCTPQQHNKTTVCLPSVWMFLNFREGKGGKQSEDNHRNIEGKRGC